MRVDKLYRQRKRGSSEGDSEGKKNLFFCSSFECGESMRGGERGVKGGNMRVREGTGHNKVFL